jgi:hypothetical protein
LRERPAITPRPAAGFAPTGGPNQFEFLPESVFSMQVLRPFQTVREKQLNPAHLALWAAALAVVFAGAARYLARPTFWLDEAFVAVSLRSPSPHSIFAPLEYGQYFPRLYLGVIAAIRGLFGYSIWALRLLPFLCFVTATLLWARLLALRSRQSALLAVFGAALLVGAGFWMDQAVQLKQYTFDVLLALVPFLIGDEFFNETLVDGKRKWALIALALGCFLSYTYPLALGARVLGWYLYKGRREGRKVKASAALVLGAAVALGLISIWMTDYRFNFIDRAAYLAYWNDCILRSSLEQGAASAIKLIAKFLWGWHGRQPLVTAGMVPLEILGVYSVIKRWRTPGDVTAGASWGSRSLGSLALLAGVIMASAFADYPICGGRVVLFTQAHTQILALEGALLVLSSRKRPKAARGFILIFTFVALFHSARAYARYLRSEPSENLRPALSLIKPEVANTVWVHPCSVAQVRALPGPLPVDHVLFGKGAAGAKTERGLAGAEIGAPQPGQKAWVLWTHMSGESCAKPLEQLRALARSWQPVYEGSDCGLALAEF